MVDYTFWAALLSLTMLEIVLGIDNVIFIALVVSHLPEQVANRARIIGLSLAFGFRISMLLGIVWLIGLTKPLFTAFGIDFSGQGLMFLGGGMFLIYKGTDSIHKELSVSKKTEYLAFNGRFWGTIIQIVLIDLVFSFDSVITAVGMTKNVLVIIMAMSIAMVVMLFSSGFIAGFITRHPTLKMLALSFVMMIGFLLVAESFGVHVPRGYIYFGMVFSLMVEVLNILVHSRRKRRSES